MLIKSVKLYNHGGKFEPIGFDGQLPNFSKHIADSFAFFKNNYLIAKEKIPKK